MQDFSWIPRACLRGLMTSALNTYTMFGWNSIVASYYNREELLKWLHVG